MLSLKQFLQILADLCVRHDMPYTYARLYDETIFATDQHDIDIVLEKTDVPALIKLLAVCPGLSLVSRIDYTHTTQLYIFGVKQHDLRFLCLDIHHALTFKGLTYLTVPAVMLRRIPAACGIGFQPDPLDLGLIYIFTHILKHQSVSPVAKKIINNAYKTNGQTFNNLIILYFNAQANRIIDRILTSTQIKPAVRQLRRIYYRKQIMHSGLFAVFAIARVMCATLWQRSFMRRDIRIVVLGTDGSGKTTLASHLNNLLKNVRPKIINAHVRPVLHWQNEPDPSLTNLSPHANPNRSWFVSNVKLLYFFMLYWLDAIWPYRGSRLIIYDRYYLDLLVDPRRFRFAGSVTLARFIFSALPRIDVFIWLNTPIAIAYNRKPELPLAAMQAQYLTYQDFHNTQGNCLVIDGTQLNSDVQDQVLTGLLPYITDRSL